MLGENSKDKNLGNDFNVFVNYRFIFLSGRVDKVLIKEVSICGLVYTHTCFY